VTRSCSPISASKTVSLSGLGRFRPASQCRTAPSVTPNFVASSVWLSPSLVRTPTIFWGLKREWIFSSSTTSDLGGGTEINEVGTRNRRWQHVNAPEGGERRCCVRETFVHDVPILRDARCLSTIPEPARLRRIVLQTALL